MNRFFHLSLTFLGVPKMRDLEVAFTDPGDDWIRVSAFTWIIWSSKSAIEIYGRLKPLLDSGDQFYVSVIDHNNAAGFLPRWVWTWMNNKVPGAVQIGDAPNWLLMPPKPPGS